MVLCNSDDFADWRFGSRCRSRFWVGFVLKLNGGLGLHSSMQSRDQGITARSVVVVGEDDLLVVSFCCFMSIQLQLTG